ncbi:Hypothetical protein CINCED_3A001516 [Cinara cedri]|uniref:Uncharacterized protein n=1 Tax=Cinara cedri TaxID=506608 RepID=A0A5E4MCI4_9HEMI|nr:Hypothetical protein CINCED_3A001516 [Cinara cedri]
MAKIMGKNPQLVDGYRKLHIFAEVIKYFETLSKGIKRLKNHFYDGGRFSETEARQFPS